MFFHGTGALVGLSNWPTAMMVRSFAVHWASCVEDVDTGGLLKAKGLDHEMLEQPDEKAVNSIVRNMPGIWPLLRFIINTSAHIFTWLEILIESCDVAGVWRGQATMADSSDNRNTQ